MTGLHPRLVAEWLRQQAVSGYVTVDTGVDSTASETFELPMEHALALSVLDSPAYIVAAGEIITGHFQAMEKIEAAFRGDGGLRYDEVPWWLHPGTSS